MENDQRFLTHGKGQDSMLLFDLIVPFLPFQSHSNGGALCLPSHFMLCSLSATVENELTSESENVQRLLPQRRCQH